MPIPVDRLALAKKRIKSVLSDRLYATVRQLESKISEAGPTNQRCNPHVITQALREMRAAGEVLTSTHPEHNNIFFYLASSESKAKSRKALAARKAEVHALYSEYLPLAQNDPRVCGDALETVMRKAFATQPTYFEIGSRSHPELNFNGKTLPGALDGTFLLLEKKILIAVETKNLREWIYSDSEELWSLINKANTISSPACPVLPVIICRKIPYYAFAAFKQIGILGFEVHHQFFDPLVEDALINIRHKDGLGFHDIKTELIYPPKLLDFLSKTVPEHGPEYADRFLRNKPLLDKLAPQLAAKTTRGTYRHTLWQEVKNSLGINAAMDHHE